ncbi:hypothetical protein ACS0TY_022524 [Phlomoides rotata]
MKEMDIVIDIEKCRDETIEELRSPDELGDVEKSRSVGAISPGSGDKVKKEKRVWVSAKKSPKPPRPPAPRGLSLDAADQKLIKEISQLLMIKRARIERIKALRKAKAAAKTSSSSSGNFIAMLFTILFCVVIVFQGCHSSGIWRRNALTIGVSTSAKPDNVAIEVPMLSEVGSLKIMGMFSDAAKAKGGRAT